ncbi:nitrous oxide reductase accessory protein NosL [Rugamonas apoptosis]|uniref:Nitrous oxide reductase accessory protein NosL n=1 Tax=Rugamonas apoptosis TaxID=2758570 RepID=A0A7W2F944_9BURK|nr:nitrous oxide reductase accessory protein NosL [Rugamonas apoptosis]MBA5687431.1 nitrous oxide reductase accessory protein NosL [Rugamonas apoptosis]
MLSSKRHYLSVATQAVALAGLLRVLFLAPSLQPADADAQPAPAPTAQAASCATAPTGQIQYDQGRPVFYCSLSAMFAMLASVEQPGFVRASFVQAAGAPAADAAGWVAASQATYVLRGPQGQGQGQGREAGSVAAFASAHHAQAYVRAGGGRLLSYQQLLTVASNVAVTESTAGLVTKT